MPETAKKTRTARSLLDLVHGAILAAAEAGHAVAPDRLGVICTSRNPPKWEADPTSPTMDPVGALILAEQPATSDERKAQLVVLGSATAFVSGVESGLTRSTEGDAIFLKPATRELYLNGLELGTWLRTELCGKACPIHGRFQEKHVVCPVCVDAAAEVA